MSEIDSAPKRKRTGGRAKGTPNKVTRDLREDIVASFYKLGGRDWLVRVARKRPDVVVALLGRVIPQETRVSLLASYQAVPIPVEQRDALPAPEATGAVLDAVFDVIGPRDPDPVPAAPASDGADWLDT